VKKLLGVVVAAALALSFASSGRAITWAGATEARI
jgi:hypothetical protein